MEAARRGHTQAVVELIKAKATVDLQDKVYVYMCTEFVLL